MKLRSLQGLEPYLKRYRRPMTLGIACALASSLLGLLPPWLLGKAVDAIEELQPGAGGGAAMLGGYAAALLALVAGSGVFAWAMRRLMTGTSRRIEFDLQEDLFRHLLQLPPSTHDRLRGGDVISRITNDLAAVREVLGPGIMWAVDTVVQTVLVATLMLLISPMLTAYALIPLPLLVLVAVWASRATHKHAHAAQGALATLSHRATLTFGGIRVVQAFQREEAERQSFHAQDTAYLAANLAEARVRALFFPAMAALPALAVAAVLFGGGWEVMQGGVTKGQLLTFFSYVAMLARPMLYLGWTITIHQRGASALERVREILREEPEDTGGDAVPDRLTGRIEWRDCTVAYGDGPPVLRDLALTVAPGEFLAIVGPIGAGKSSLLQTLPRLLDPPGGTTWADGVDVRQWPVDRLRAAIGYVPQLPFLFSATVRTNIALGRQAGATDAAIAAAASAAGLDPDLAEWPQGLDTRVGERGVAVSGGQRQRIAIARSLLADAPILLLDDCLSSLDAETAERILGRLREARGGGTHSTLLATHRIAEAARCDRIAVLDRGRVVQLGTHAELAAVDGLYARLVERQRLEAEIEGPHGGDGGTP